MPVSERRSQLHHPGTGPGLRGVPGSITSGQAPALKGSQFLHRGLRGCWFHPPGLSGAPVPHPGTVPALRAIPVPSGCSQLPIPAQAGGSGWLAAPSRCRGFFSGLCRGLLVAQPGPGAGRGPSEPPGASPAAPGVARSCRTRCRRCCSRYTPVVVGANCCASKASLGWWWLCKAHQQKFPA